MSMFKSKADTPRAITTNHPDDYGVAQRWCIDRMDDSPNLLVWFAQKNMMDNDPDIERFCSQHGVVVGITRGHRIPASWRGGPALVMWADEEDIAAVERLRGATAICVVPSSVRDLSSWVDGHNAERLGRAAQAAKKQSSLDPVVRRALETMNPNLNNVLTSGYDKDIVASRLLALQDAGYRLDVRAIKTWAVAAGWPAKRVIELGKLAAQVSSGSRPRVRAGMLTRDWVKIMEAQIRDR